MQKIYKKTRSVCVCVCVSKEVSPPKVKVMVILLRVRVPWWVNVLVSIHSVHNSTDFYIRYPKRNTKGVFTYETT